MDGSGADMAAMTYPILSVAAGGALGAVLRFGCGVWLARDGFPFAVLAVNVIGSFAMGLLAVALLRSGAAGMQPFLMTGVLGGFTTFSAFSLETAVMIERGQVGAAGIYVVGSVALSVGALFLGLVLARSLT